MKIVGKRISENTTRFTFQTSCTHCGREVVFNPAMIDETFAPGRDGKEACYLLCRCLNCDNLSLFRVNGAYYEEEDGLIHNLIDENAEQVWPEPSDLKLEGSERVRHLYKEAQKVKLFPSSFVVQIGRTLEAAANDKGAKGRTLNDKLNWLVNEGVLPGVIGEMAHVNRSLRNWGAHDLEVEVEEEDVEIVDEFFRTIIEYLYAAPARVKKVQDLIEARKQESSKSKNAS